MKKIISGITLFCVLASCRGGNGGNDGESNPIKETPILLTSKVKTDSYQDLSTYEISYDGQKIKQEIK